MKPLADLTTLVEGETFDWEQSQDYVQAIGVGECAGVAFDVVGAIIGDAQKKLHSVESYFVKKAFAEAIYSSYTAFVIGAKAALLARDVRCNTHIGILEDFQTHYIATGDFFLENGDSDFVEHVLELNQHSPQAAFAEGYLLKAKSFLEKIITLRESQLADKQIVENYRA